jgi:pSer/pThr/pTyr-binding forkhead associated (FHA) protein/outer membrane biosynthesis protein TonB
MEQKAQATTSGGIPIRLDVLGPDGTVIHTAEFAKDKIVLGRIISADLRIDDPRVSRIHALLEVRGGSILLTDLASSHGTWINGKKVVETKVSFGDTIKLGFIELRVEKGSGRTSNSPVTFEGSPVVEGAETLVDIDRSMLDKTDRRGPDRRKKDAFPEERRLEDRRGGDRRVDQRKGDRRTTEDQSGDDNRLGMDRRQPPAEERRVGDRRRGDRRVFDITSLERRIEDRRTRKTDDDVLPEELEKAFEAPSHARELEVTVLWGDHILDVSNYVDECVLSIGESPTNDYIIPSVGIPDEFPLISIREDGTATLAFTKDMQGTVRARDKIYTLSDLTSEKFVKQSGSSYLLPLKQDDFAKLSIGTINFFILYVRPAPRILPPPFFERDALLMRTAGSSILIFLLLLIGLQFVPKPVPVTVEMIPERFAKIIIKARPKLPPSKSGLSAPNEESKEGGSKAGEGGPAIGPEGEAGRKDKPRKEEKAQAILPKSKPKDTSTPSPNVSQNNSPQKRKVVDQKKAQSVGLLQAFSKSGIQKDMNNLINAGEGPEGPGGFDDFGKAVSGFRGKTLEETGGAGGKGLRGVEAGGGGKTIGIDGPSTKGLGRGYHGDGIGEGVSGPGRFGQKGEHAIDIVSENVQVLSGLSKDIINAVINRNRPLIRACYDTALRRNPQLNGKVVMFFDISKDGKVIRVGVKESTVGDAGLGNCIADRIRNMEFPRPEAPVTTEVTAFPFYLKPAN